MSEDIVGKILRGYEIRKILGQGGFGAVYRAHQALLKRDVAIKVILPEYANDPDFIRRFEVEAELIARLEHPHIVPLYDFWRDPTGAFLVMRLVSGGSLRDAMESRQLTIDEIATIMDQIGAALTVAHREKVIHRDIKPDNILIDADANAYLSDFGIATIAGVEEADEEEAGISGSVDYIPPEQFMGELPSPKSDIYALGMVLYELLTGEHPFQGQTISQLIQSHLHTPLPSIDEKKPEHGQFDNVVQRAANKDPDMRYDTPLELAKAFRAAISDGGFIMGDYGDPEADFDTLFLRPLDIPNPYRGLQAFQEADSDKFYGRTALVEHLLKRLMDPVEHQRLLVVIGASGSGKSSVVKAGLIPTLRAGRLPGSDNWFIAETVPGAYPFEMLEEALLKVGTNPVENLQAGLQAENGIHAMVNQLLPADDSELVLIIDQFEELFTLVEDEAERTRFIENLMGCITHKDSRVRVIVTLRADFYDKPLQYRAFGEMVRERMDTVLPLSPEELAEAIERPAEDLGVAFEPGLVDTIINDVGSQPGTLPLLQYALTELFDKREGVLMSLAGYQTIGGVTGALARRADELYEELPGDEWREAVRQLFLRLVTVGDDTEATRRRIRRSELADTEIMEDVINRYGKSRLLTFDRDAQTREATIEVAHEAIIRNWSRLKDWIDDSRETLQIQNRLTTAANEWQLSDKNVSYLASGVRLGQFEGLLASDVALSALEKAFITASVDNREAVRREEEARRENELQLQRQAASRLRYLVGIMVVFLIVAVGLTVFAFGERSNAQTQAEIAQRSAAEALSVALATNAQEWATRNQELALSLAIEANSIDDPPALARIVLNELAYQPGVAYIWPEHRDRVITVTFSPDGRFAAAGSGDTNARIWDVETGVELHHLRDHTDAVWIVVFSPDGSMLATGSTDNTIRLWDVETGAMLRLLEGHTDQVRDLNFNPDGTLLLSGSFDDTAKLWDVASGEVLQTFTGHTDNIFRVDYAPDGSRIVTASFDNTARIWDPATGDLLHSLEGHTNEIREVAFSPDGTLVATASADTTARLWDVATGATIHTLVGHTNWVMSLAFSPDGTTIATGSADTTARLWNVETAELIHNYVGHADRIETLAFSPAGDMVLTGCWDSTTNLWSAGSGRLIHTFAGHSDTVKSVAFSPTGDYIMTGSLDSVTRLWDVSSPELIDSYIGHTAAVLSVAFNPEGTELLTGSVDDSVRRWDIATGATTGSLQEPTNWVRSANFNSDASRVVAGGDDMTGFVWDAESGALLQTLEGHANWIMSAHFTSDDSRILTASLDFTARLWNAETGEVIRTYEGHEAGLLSADFGPDDRLFVTGAEDDVVIVWDTESAGIVQRLEGHEDDVFAVAFSPDGSQIASGAGDATVRVWDVATGDVIYTLTGHTGDVRAVAFSPDGSQLLSASEDNTARLWDLTTGDLIHSYTGHSSEVVSVAFSPDGRQVATASWDRTVRLWTTDLPENLVAWTYENWQVQELPCDQRALYGLDTACDEVGVFPTRTPYPISAGG